MTSLHAGSGETSPTTLSALDQIRIKQIEGVVEEIGHAGPIHIYWLIDQLRAASDREAALRKDTERLDAMERYARRNIETGAGNFHHSAVIDATHYNNDEEGVIEFTAMGPPLSALSRGSYRIGNAPTIREAIDAAIACELASALSSDEQTND